MKPHTMFMCVRFVPGDSSAWSSVASFTLPSCFVPTGAAVANVTDVSADFSWTDANNIPAPAETKFHMVLQDLLRVLELSLLLRLQPAT